MLRQTVEGSGGESGFAVVMDSRTGELLAVADHPTFDANVPTESPKEDLGSRAMQDVYEPGSVEKVLTLSSLIDLGVLSPRTEIVVPPSLQREDSPIGDWFDHGTIHLTLAGVLAKSSNIGTVLAADRFEAGQLHEYLTRFGLGQTTDIGVRGETEGLLPDAAFVDPPDAGPDRVRPVALGQRRADGRRDQHHRQRRRAGLAQPDPGLGDDRRRRDRRHRHHHRAPGDQHQGRAPDDADDGARRRRPRSVSHRARRSRATGSPARPVRHSGSAPSAAATTARFTVSFAGFAPADDPQFTIYVVVQNPSNGGGGGSVAGPAFAKIMSYALKRYAVPPTGTRPSRLPVEW